jgi:histidine phosphotransfer protein HptB
MTNQTIDLATFHELKETMGEDFIPELVATYLEEIPELLKTLKQGLEDGNAQTFTRAAHSIKSSSASMGALDFAAQARELEMIGKSGDLSQAGAHVDRLVAAYPEVEHALRNLL